MVFAGDELGLEGAWGEDARRTMPWDRPESWDADLLRELRAPDRAAPVERRRSPAAALRYAHVGDDAIAYLREHGDERLLCLAARADHEPVRLPLEALGCQRARAVLRRRRALRAGIATLPADGPAFHVWRLEDDHG